MMEKNGEKSRCVLHQFNRSQIKKYSTRFFNTSLHNYAPLIIDTALIDICRSFRLDVMCLVCVAKRER